MEQVTGHLQRSQHGDSKNSQGRRQTLREGGKMQEKGGGSSCQGGLRMMRLRTLCGIVGWRCCLHANPICCCQSRSCPTETISEKQTQDTQKKNLFLQNWFMEKEHRHQDSL